MIGTISGGIAMVDTAKLVEKRKKQLGIEAEALKREATRKAGLIDQQLVKERIAKRTEQKKEVLDVFKGKEEEEEKKPPTTSKRKRRSKPTVELEGEEVSDGE